MSVKERITDFLTNSNYHIKNALSDYKDYKLVRMNICRKPVEQILLKIISTLNSDFSTYVKAHGYDSIFHLYAIFEITDGNEI